MNLKHVTVTTLIISLTVALASGCGVGEASVAPESETRAATPIPVETAMPTRIDIVATYEATTTIASDADAPVVAKVGGEVVRLLVEEGDRVVAGQVLAELDGERLRLEMLSARANLEQARGEYERYTDLAARGLVSEAMFEGLKYDLEALEATYNLARLNFEYSKIRAPIDGVISSRYVKLGQSIDPADEAFRITDTSELLAYLQIPQGELGKFSAGQAATLKVDAMPEATYSATIARISPTIDVRNGTFRATAFIDNRSGELAPGMFARFSIAYDRHADALVIPRTAIVEEDDQTSVYVVADGAVARRVIQVGIESGKLVEVVDGLAMDEEVVVTGQASLRDGSKVLASNDSGNNYAG
ncbi:MAG TPA: efflux RND transporter periplasmic adaptor subunit [Woeseiaceae bacterium]|nr:efflux RND transporter periplasmic adaptor subunit [Woeseiaceae bacterium]